MKEPQEGFWAKTQTSNAFCVNRLEVLRALRPKETTVVHHTPVLPVQARTVPARCHLAHLPSALSVTNSARHEFCPSCLD